MQKKKVQSWRRKVETTEERNALHEADGDGSGAGFGRRLQEIGSKKKRLLGSKNAMLQDSPAEALPASDYLSLSRYLSFSVLHHIGAQCSLVTNLVTNSVTNSVTNLVITKQGDKFVTKFVTKFGVHQIW